MPLIPTMKVLYGPPGTGKTWLAAREAVRAIEPDQYKSLISGEDSDTKLSELHASLVAEGRIVWVTFHPSYSYEDFVEGYRPVVDEDGRLSYRVVDGPFKALCQRAAFKADLQIGDQLTDGSGKPAGLVVGKDAGGWVVEVRVGRRDAVAATLRKYVPRYIVNGIMEKGLPASIFSIPGAGVFPLQNYGIDSSDSDVPAPRENEDADNRQGATIRKIIAGRTGIMSSSDLSNASHIGSVLRRLEELREGNSATSTPVVLVIDEINRAETSRVFGELLTLLETDKRSGMSEERRVALPYSRELFSVPQEVSVIGTMNTVDRSLASLDFAMRRRFDFVSVASDDSLVMQGSFESSLQMLHKRINDRLKLLLGTGYEIGHSIFMEGRISATRMSQGWEDSPDGDLRALAYIFRSNLVPTLGEYLSGDWTKVRAVAGLAKTSHGLESLFESVGDDPAFSDRLSDGYELGDIGLGVYSDWWDPKSEFWRESRFREFIAALSEGK